MPKLVFGFTYVLWACNAVISTVAMFTGEFDALTALVFGAHSGMAFTLALIEIANRVGTVTLHFAQRD